MTEESAVAVVDAEAAAGPAGAASVQSLVRGLSVIRVFDAEHPAMTLSDVARRASLSRATARRVLHTLVALGYVGTDGRLFTLRPQVLELGWSYLSSLRLPELAQPHLEQLSAQVGESSSAAVLDGTEVVYVARVATRRIMTVAIHVGTRFPAHLTSMGRVLLADLPKQERAAYLARVPLERKTPHTLTDPVALGAELDRIAAQGWAVVDQELELGLRSIAAPVRDRDGRAVAAVNISAQTRHGTLAELRDELLAPLLETTAAIARDLSLTSA
jgi:IclR family pca regulon transcriptional regulator